MNRRLLTVPVLVGAALALAACSGPTTGSPSPAASATGGPTAQGGGGGGSPSGGSPSADPLASVDPCSLITQDEVSKNGFQALGPKTEDGARGCGWQQGAGTSGDGFVIDVRLYDHVGLDGIKTDGDQVSSKQVGSHKASQIKFLTGPGAGGCAVVMAVTANSSVYVSGQDGAGNQDAACTDANQAAGAIEPRIPAQTG